MRTNAWPGAVASILALFALCCSPEKEDDMSDAQRALYEQVQEAFNACRAGDFGPSSALAEAGEPVVMFMAQYVVDADENVREQAVAVLKAVGGENAAPLLLRALTDEVAGIRERAAHALFTGHDPVAVAALPDAGDAIRGSVAAGNHTAAALLLLGYCPGDESVSLLQKVRDADPMSRTELHAWTPVVDASLPARVSLSQLGEMEDRIFLLENAATADADQLQFLLSVLREVDAPALLHELARTLDDTTEIGGGAPSGAEPVRRICDLAVDAFVERLDLSVDFPLNDSGRYTEEQIQAVREAIEGAIPR